MNIPMLKSILRHECPGGPFLSSFVPRQLQTATLVSGADFGPLRLENSGQHQGAARCKQASKARLFCEQQVNYQVRANQVMLLCRLLRQAAQILTRQPHLAQYSILLCIGSGHLNGLRINIKTHDRLVAKLGSRDGQDTGACSEVQKRFRASCFLESDNLLQTELRGRMMAGPEAEAWIENHALLIFP